jgi:hypothetical protein
MNFFKKKLHKITKLSENEIEKINSIKKQPKNKSNRENLRLGS